MDNIVIDLLKRTTAMPSMPQVAVRFLEIVQQPDFDFHEVVEIFSTDPGSTSDILRLANSPLFGVTRQITSLQHALILLGLKRVRSLVLGRYIVDSIDRKNVAGLDTAYYWRRSINTAILSARLAEFLDNRHRDEAFIAGLLADMGIVILAEVLHEKYHPILERYRPGGPTNLATMEMEQIGIHHGQASALVLEHWQLPEIVCEAVRWHPWDIQENQAPLLAQLVGAADRIAQHLCEKPENLDTITMDCVSIMAELNLEPSVLAQALADSQEHIRELAALLRVEIIDSGIYNLIADRLRNTLIEAGAQAPSPA
ncbi:MAG: HDOD domain-containing protein [Phycisphaerales bacterium]|nr:HDOD domain-containing protein [Phycisphaerales bacterium]